MARSGQRSNIFDQLVNYEHAAVFNRTYRGLGEAVDYPMNYHVTGSIRLAHSKERMQEFERAAGMGRYQGMPIEILNPAETQERYPFLETHDLTGSLYDPHDGDIDPAQLTQALAKGARDMGAQILRFTPATGVSRENGEWIVHTEKGDIRCEYVVNAAGYYAQRVGEWFKPYGGRTVPMMVMSHQYLLSEEVPEIEAYTKETGHKLPLLRDVDSSYYLRQEKHGFNLGPYERNCKGHWMTPNDPMPDDFSFQLYPDDLERIEWYIEDAMARVPLLGTSGVSRVINGPIPYAPDGLPLIGPMPGVPNAFEAVYSHSGSRNLAARARYWRNGWSKDKPNGICGRSIRVVTPIIRTKITVTKRAWKFMVTNMRCISHGTNGPRDATKKLPSSQPPTGSRRAIWGL